jgi:hypothetical protein
VSRRRVLVAAFVLLEFSSPSRRIFIGSHSLPPSLVRRIGPSDTNWSLLVLSCIFGVTICLFSELRHAIVYARLVYIHKALSSTIWRLFTRTPEFYVLLLASIVADRKRKIMNYASVEIPRHIMWTLWKVIIHTTLEILQRGIPWLHCNLSIAMLMQEIKTTIR